MLSQPCQLGRPAPARRESAVPIERIGEHAARVLDSSTGGTVANIFTRSVYLSGASGALICLLPEGSGMGPTCLGHSDAPTVDWSGAGLRVGEQWARLGNCLTVGRAAAFSLERARPWRPPAPGCWTPAALAPNLRSLRGPLAANARGPLISLVFPGLAPRSPTEAAVARHARPAIWALKAWLVRQMAKGARPPEGLPGEVRALLGLGPGLTPSGDDFLAGALVALRAMSPPRLADALAEGVEQAMPGKTSRISESHLRAACRGQGAEALHLALNALLSPSPGDLEARVHALCELGESSGCDALAGVVLVASARCETL